jgi:peptidoglycan-N-acetylmuramic acid deacetylase
VIVLTLSWGLGFPQEGKPPVGTVSAEYLKQFDAAYIGSTTENTVYLTFDAGYENGQTASILDTLKEKNVPAAFFVVGHYVDSEPDLLRRMATEGHTVCNHTVKHPDMAAITDPEAFRAELDGLGEKFKAVTGTEMAKIYRPPSGKFNEKNLRLAQKLGYKTLLWSLAYVDWYRDKQPDPGRALEKLTKRIHPGAVLLLHSTSRTNAEILGRLIDQYRAMGYTFGTVNQIFT